MDRLVKALYMTDEFRYMVVSTPFLIWKNQNIKCQLKVKLKSKLKNLNIKSLDLVVMGMELLDIFLNQKFNSTCINVTELTHGLHIRILDFFNTYWFFWAGELRKDIWINSYYLNSKFIEGSIICTLNIHVVYAMCNKVALICPDLPKIVITTASFHNRWVLNKSYHNL